MKKIINTILLFILVLVLGAGSYCGYIIFSYKRIGNVSLEVESKAVDNVLLVNETYNMATYNIGFGAYSQDYTFFLDTGYDINEKETCGYYSTARSKEEVNFNVNGAIDTIEGLDLDFVLLQEVDVKSTRSYKINQNDMFKESLSEYDNVFAINFDTAYLPYPLYDMHGKSLAGLSTFSRYKIEAANRYEYTISDSLSKLFDIDRCFSVSNIKVENGKTLYVINSHMSAYDKGGVIRQTQIQELNDFISSCLSEGNYVIVGGDFNHDLLTNNPDFEYDNNNRPFENKLKNPDWLSAYFDENKKSPLVDGFRVVASDNVPTCRNNDIEWDPSLTFKCVVDGFVVSNNIEIVTHYNV
jgi:endonuclease/exonuclease/phosphatase family metal-dependent hydrolase